MRDETDVQEPDEQEPDVLEDLGGFAQPSSRLDRRALVGMEDGVGEPEAHYETFADTLNELCNMYTPSKWKVKVKRELIQHLCDFAFSGRLPDGLRETFDSKCHNHFDLEAGQGKSYILFDDECELNVFLSAFAHIAESVALEFRLAYHWHWFRRLIEFAVRESNRPFDTLSIEEKRRMFEGLYEQAVRENVDKEFETKAEWDECVRRFDFSRYNASTVARGFAYGMHYECCDEEEYESGPDLLVP